MNEINKNITFNLDKNILPSLLGKWYISSITPPEGEKFLFAEYSTDIFEEGGSDLITADIARKNTKLLYDGKPCYYTDGRVVKNEFDHLCSVDNFTDYEKEGFYFDDLDDVLLEVDKFIFPKGSLITIENSELYYDYNTKTNKKAICTVLYIDDLEIDYRVDSENYTGYLRMISHMEKNSDRTDLLNIIIKRFREQGFLCDVNNQIDCMGDCIKMVYAFGYGKSVFISASYIYDICETKYNDCLSFSVNYRKYKSKSTIYLEPIKPNMENLDRIIRQLKQN